jgi:hypothetical protein
MAAILRLYRPQNSGESTNRIALKSELSLNMFLDQRLEIPLK